MKFAVVLLALVAGCLAQDKDLVDTLTDLGCSTTVAMIERGGLEGVIRQGQFTLFAPSNAAWDAMPDDMREVIVGSPIYLSNVLTYHMTVEQVRAGDLENEKTIQGVEGSLLRANIYRGGALVTITGNPVSTVDVEASNGLIHLIDRVIFPLPSFNMYEVVASEPDLTSLASLVNLAGLDETLRTGGPFTLFAPSNAAFSEVPDEILEDLIRNPDKLRAVLLYHVIGSTNWSASLVNGADVPTLRGQTVRITIDSNGVKINNAAVDIADAAVSNGVIHYVDKVLLPPQ